MADKDKNTENETEDIKVEKKEQTESPLLGDAKKTGAEPEHEQIVVVKESFWDRFKIFKLSIEEKAVITEDIINEIEAKPLYWVQLFLSTIIATFGLLQNSVAIIIGAMLLAPLLNPIKGLAFAITTGKATYFWKAAKLQIISIFAAICIAYGVSLIIPLKIETTEILARTSPNLLDLLIAVAAGTIAILSLYFKKLSENIAGVAMAAAILPPLAVFGIELALENYAAVWGSMFLFLTNLFAIIAIGVIIFLLYGFYPDQKDSKQRSIRIGLIVFMLLILISVPLFSSLTNIAERINLQTKANKIFHSVLETDYPGVSLKRLDIIEHDEGVVNFSGSLKTTGEIDDISAIQETILEEFVEKFGREVNLELEIIPVFSLSSKT